MDKKVSNDIKEESGHKEFRLSKSNPLNEITGLKAKIKLLESENQRLKRIHDKINDVEKALSESEERYNTLLKSSKNIIMMIHEGVIVYSNLSGLRALGYSYLNELKGKSFYEILDPLGYDFVRKRFKRMEEAKSSETGQLKFIRKDGTKVLIEITALPVDYEHERATLVIGQNITPWKETELALRESEQKLKALFDCSPDNYFITDLNYSIRFFNRPPLFYTIKDLLGKNMLEFFFHDFQDIAGKSFEQVRNTGRTAGFEISLSKDAEIRWYYCRIAALIYENKLEGFIIVLTDISQQKESEFKLVESEQRYISLFDNINSGVIILQPDEQKKEYVIRDINKAALKIFRVSKNKMKGKPISDFFKGHGETGITRRISAVCQNNEPLFIPAQYIRDKRFEGWVEHYIYKISGGEIIVVIEDVTEKYLATSELKKARQEWQEIFEAVGQPTFILDTEHNILAANRAVIELTGKKQDELKKHKCYDIFHNRKGQAAENCPMSDLLRLKKTQTREMEVETLSGTFMVSCTPVLDSSGEITKIIHIATDITEIKRAKEELSKSLKRYQKLLDTIPYGVDEINTEGTILLTNLAHVKMLGCKGEDLIGKSIFDLQTTDKDREILSNYFKQIIIERPEPVPFVGKNITCDGRIIDVQVDWNYLEGSDGELVGFITVISNVTERIKYEKALNDARLKAEESDRLKSAFLTNMSHEIRTPLNVITGFSAMLNEKKLTPERINSYHNYIHEGATQLLSIINNIIDISRLESNQLPIMMKKTDLNKLMMEMKDYFENEIRKSNKSQLKFSINIPGQQEKFHVITDEIKLRQVLMNLLSNAVKFTEKGIIELGYEKTGKTVLQFYVKDTGIGITKEKQAVIFDRFRQEDDSLTREYAGAGLGLAISKGILEIMGGTIRVESAKNKGSVFYFTIPYQVPETRKRKGTVKSGKLRLDDKKILVVEDDPVSAALIEATLKPTGAALIFAKDGKEAIDCFSKNTDIDLVLLDIRLPYLDGYSIAKHIKKLKPEISILAHSAYAMEKEKTKAREAGVDFYLTKPSSSSEILKSISLLLNIGNEHELT